MPAQPALRTPDQRKLTQRASSRIAALFGRSAKGGRTREDDDDDDLPRPNATISGLLPLLRATGPSFAF